jgi:formate dehydrogenase maturation protein FdhE
MAQPAQAPFEQWVETANHLARHSASTVACPCCGSTSLSVRDVDYGFGHDRGVQRYISCGCCGAFNSVNVKCAGETENRPLQAAE